MPVRSRRWSIRRRAGGDGRPSLSVDVRHREGVKGERFRPAPESHVERAASGLTDKEHLIHDHALVAILREIHDDLDAAVLAAYAWPRDIDTGGILWNLVALNAERAAEERRNVIRWLRPEFQQPGAAAAQTLSLGLNVVAPEEIDVAPAKWPATLSDRITAVREALSRTDEAIGVEQVSRRFKGARRADVEAILESLSALGIAVALDAGQGRRWMRARAAA